MKLCSVLAKPSDDHPDTDDEEIEADDPLEKGGREPVSLPGPEDLPKDGRNRHHRPECQIVGC